MDKTCLTVTSHKDRDILDKTYQGHTCVKLEQLQHLKSDFELLNMKSSEITFEHIHHVISIANNMKALGDNTKESEIVLKILRSMTSKFNTIVCMLSERSIKEDLSLDEVHGLGFSRGRGLKGRGGERYMVKEGARYHREYNFNQRQRGRGCGYDRVRAPIEEKVNHTEKSENESVDRIIESETNSTRNDFVNTNGGNLDPLLIANSDNPTSSLVSAVFSATNFIRWIRNVRCALIAKNKDGFSTRSTPKPSESSQVYLKWIRADYMVMSWILSSMTPQIADHFAYKEIDSLRQENLTIIAYYGKIKRLWDELKSLIVSPTYCCGALSKCSCQFVKRLADIKAEDKLMQFLLGLNSGFDSTITNILSMEPLPTINKAFSIAQQIEKQKEITGVLEAGESNVMVVQKYNQGGMSAAIQRFQGKRDWKKEKFDKKCDHYKGKGHTMDQCFKLIGYPEWYTAVKNAKGGNASGIGGSRKFVANVHIDNGHCDSPPDCEDDSNYNDGKEMNSYMINNICQEVMKMMKGKDQTNTSSPGNMSFASFAGACDHMVYDEHMLIDKKLLKREIKVGLPDGTFRMVYKTRTVVLNEHLSINDVLLVEDFKHYLLSVSKLAEKDNVLVHFTKDNCYFQDLYKHKVLGIGKKQGGLYYYYSNACDINKRLCASSSCHAVETSSSTDMLPSKTAVGRQIASHTINDVHLLHSRLRGHLSLSKMRHIPGFSCRNMHEYNGGICLNSKQHKLPFSVSKSRADQCFDLLHIDLWGPYRVHALNGAKYFLTLVDNRSRGTWTFLLHNKSQVAKTLEYFLKMVETQFGTRVKIIRSDNGTEIVKK
ncbi:uncharacterized protein LOC125493557 [Beta vulgaris subsp. vulgaris]|uniref:uncharacterized protein LOC125493557 n=1 Tax=Beta vulgaris subsp. vulgaris TaxID=3555 RepID=UPI0020372A00|nr:uncharacterized protein LOC125493557 [Beta vulgaris subsp. vulgaris]